MAIQKQKYKSPIRSAVCCFRVFKRNTHCGYIYNRRSSCIFCTWVSINTCGTIAYIKNRMQLDGLIVNSLFVFGLLYRHTLGLCWWRKFSSFLGTKSAPPFCSCPEYFHWKCTKEEGHHFPSVLLPPGLEEHFYLHSWFFVISLDWSFWFFIGLPISAGCDLLLALCPVYDSKIFFKELPSLWHENAPLRCACCLCNVLWVSCKARAAEFLAWRQPFGNAPSWVPISQQWSHLPPMNLFWRPNPWLHQDQSGPWVCIFIGPNLQNCLQPNGPLWSLKKRRCAWRPSTPVRLWFQAALSTSVDCPALESMICQNRYFWKMLLCQFSVHLCFILGTPPHGSDSEVEPILVWAQPVQVEKLSPSPHSLVPTQQDKPLAPTLFRWILAIPLPFTKETLVLPTHRALTTGVTSPLVSSFFTNVHQLPLQVCIFLQEFQLLINSVSSVSKRMRASVTTWVQN